MTGKVYSSQELTFEQLLRERLDEKTGQKLQFSKHAAARVEERGIELTSGLMGDLQNAVEKARGKGAKDVVVIGQQGAFIVNVPHNVVVTTMSPGEMRENIFTNIDSAVIM
ncbi:MAG: TIGR02530 family flagellar biosynthesis protein [Hungatella sp.]